MVTPTATQRITYNGEVKVIRRLCEMANGFRLELDRLTEMVNELYEHSGIVDYYPRFAFDDEGYIVVDYGDGSGSGVAGNCYPRLALDDEGYLTVDYGDGDSNGGAANYHPCLTFDDEGYIAVDYGA